MIELETALVFLAACLAVNISPGPSIVYVSTMAATHGSRAGLLSALGLGFGALAHIVAAALGISAILASSAVAFTIVKYLGAAYLVYLGLKLLLSRAQVPETGFHPGKRESLGPVAQGAIVDLLNPKIAIFFLAFLPQFVTPESGNTFWQVILLGMMFIASGFVVNGSIALAVGRTVQHVDLSRYAWATRWLPGCILVGLGARLATIDHQ